MKSTPLISYDLGVDLSGDDAYLSLAAALIDEAARWNGGWLDGNAYDRWRAEQRSRDELSCPVRGLRPEESTFPRRSAVSGCHLTHLGHLMTRSLSICAGRCTRSSRPDLRHLVASP